MAKKYTDVKIFTKDLDNGANLVILVGGLNEEDPANYMDGAVAQYVKNNEYNEFIEKRLDNPWVRVLIFNMNNLIFGTLPNDN